MRVPNASDELGLKIICFRISPPGDGKSLLDQHFGHLKGRCDKNLDCGEEGKNKADNAYQTATPIFDTGNGIRQTKAWVITFDRKQTHKTDPNLPARLKKLMTVIKEISRAPNGDLLFREHTGFGRGIVINMEDQATMWSNVPHLKGAVPVTKYTTVSVPAAGETKLVQHARSIKGEITKKKEKDDKLKKKTRRKQYLEKCSSIQSTTASGQIAAGMHRCCVTNNVGARCINLYCSEAGLAKHLERISRGIGCHHFPSAFNKKPENVVGNFASDPATLFAAFENLRARPANAAERVKLIEKATNMTAERTFRSSRYPGNARSGMEKQERIYKTEIQKKALLEMYMEGVTDSGKTVTAETAYDRMRNKLTASGVRFYSRSTGNGILLSVLQIKAYFGSLHSAYKKQGHNKATVPPPSKKTKVTKESTLAPGIIAGLGKVTVEHLVATVPTFEHLATLKRNDIITAANLIGNNLAAGIQKITKWRELCQERFQIDPIVEDSEDDAEENDDEEEENANSDELVATSNDGDDIGELYNEWDTADQPYSKDDIVRYDGELFIALKDQPGEDWNNWDEM